MYHSILVQYSLALIWDKDLGILEREFIILPERNKIEHMDNFAGECVPPL
jgi:hypothetical protein